ncbi:dTDP-4-dehydrorhamnose 3,5-epimerase family protein [Polynucleobacter sp. AP-Melu-500A-A1]|uniref:dTDP-4-dehydrorhamnose 3,5-epimerase family protein n=1 Tax=Polynucleobacter sp. AP-Melu-500A-A1 TaxID=2576929 RepID=UPI001C0BAA8F|nr:dTDP-4-dehydrorhamnose 3,5-epimerase family protein [Polynucleobacter sp. AP-Melu-500A-A1]
MFSKIATKIDGFYEILPEVNEDTRGIFVKTYQKSNFLSMGIDANWKEQYYSISKKGVLRGLHFQLPPHAHQKLVCCLSGEVVDVVVDLRINSPTYGQHAIVQLSTEKRNGVFIDVGLAHGFYTISESAMLLYNVSTEYEPNFDAGIRWDSAGINWGDINPIISARDSSFIGMNEFHSPFSS